MTPTTAPDDTDVAIAKYGGVATTPPPVDDTDAAIAKYGGVAAIPQPQKSTTDMAWDAWKAANPTMGAVADVAGGAWKGLKHTVSQVPTPYMNYKTPPPRPDLAPSNVPEKIGYGAEQAAEFLAPGGAEADAGRLIDAATKIPAARLLGKAIVRGGTAGVVAGGQTGGDPAAMRNAAIAAGGTSAAIEGAAPLLKKAAVRTYMSAMKPSTGLDQAARAKLFQTAQVEGIPVSEGGLSAAGDKIDALQQQVNDAISNAPAGQGISKFDVAKRLNDTSKTFATQATPQDDLAAISNKGNQFLDAQPNTLTPQEAQDVKVGTYGVLRKKGAYGEQSAAGDEAQKALARGLKEELQARIPELQGLNAQEGSLIQLEGALQKSVARIQNVNKIPMRSLLAASAGIAGGGAHGGTMEGAGAGLGLGLLAYALDDPWVKSRLAIAIGRGADALAANSGAAAQTAAPLAAAASRAMTPPTPPQRSVMPPPQ